MDIMSYLKPELLVVAIVCYFIGMALKSTNLLKDKFIPLVLGVFSIVVCLVWVLATSTLLTTQDVFLAIFTAITQGVLAAGLSTYVNQLIKQTTKED